MRRVYTAENIFDAQLVCDALLREGIEAVVHGALLTGALGELPTDTRPAVWIGEDGLYDRARRIVARFESAVADAPGWRCSACGEVNGPAFDLCWQCGRAAPSPDATEPEGDS